jgi:hypothetical protein
VNRQVIQNRQFHYQLISYEVFKRDPDVSYVFISLFSKNTSSLVKSPVCLSACPPLIRLNRLIEFREIWYGGDAIQGDIDVIYFFHSFNHFKIIEVQNC